MLVCCLAYGPSLSPSLSKGYLGIPATCLAYGLSLSQQRIPGYSSYLFSLWPLSLCKGYLGIPATCLAYGLSLSQQRIPGYSSYLFSFGLSLSQQRIPGYSSYLFSLWPLSLCKGYLGIPATCLAYGLSLSAKDTWVFQLLV